MPRAQTIAEPRPRLWRIVVIANVALLMAVAIWMRVWKVDSLPGVNGDEAWYGVIALEIGDGRLSTWRTPTGNPLNPFYFGPLVIAHLLAQPSVALLRSVAVASGILVLPVNYWLCRRLYGRRTAILSTTILAVLPINIAYSRFGWDASQSVLATLPALYGSLAAVRQPRAAWKWLLAAGASLAAAILVHPTNVFIAPLCVIAAGVAWRRTGKTSRSLATRYVVIASTAATAIAIVGGLLRFGQSYLVAAARRAIDIEQMAAFVDRFQKFFSGATAYQFISGAMSSNSDGTIDAALIAHDIAALAILAFAAVFVARRAVHRPGSVDSVLAWGWAASLVGFYLVAGPDAIAPHWERYGMWMIAPTSLVVARAAHAWSVSKPRKPQRVGLLLIVGWLLLGSFYLNYFQPFMTTGGTSHPTFRTGSVEPKTAALAHIVEQAATGQSQWIIADTWWNYWPLAYLAGRNANVKVLAVEEARAMPEFEALVAEGRVWIVQFTDEIMQTGALASFERRTRHAQTYDYADRAVHNVDRIATEHGEPPSEHVRSIDLNEFERFPAEQFD